MSMFIVVSYIISTLVAATTVYFWRKLSTEMVETIIVAISSWLSTLAVLNFIGVFK